jgi:hypothetical protein
MTRRVHIFIILGLAFSLLVIFLVWRAPRESQFTSLPSLVSPPTSPLPLSQSPLRHPTATSIRSPLPIPPTAESPVTTATLEAIRATRPTATPLASRGVHLPHISPDTWRAWALRLLVAAGVIAYIGLRLRKGQ